MATDIIVYDNSGRPRKYQRGDDGSETPYVIAGGSGGAAGAITAADGAIVTLGAQADAAAATDTATATLMALFKRALQRLTTLISLFPTSLGTKTAANSFPVTPSSDGIFITKPFAEILNYNASLVGANDQVDTNEYGASVQVSLGGTYSGEVLNMMLYSQESGTGSIQAPQCIVYFFNANPSISAGATAILVGNWSMAIGSVQIASTDWIGDANGKFVFKTVGISFAAVSSLYAAIFNQGSSINDAAGDDETVVLAFSLRRDS